MEKIAYVGGDDLDTIWSLLSLLDPSNPYPVHEVAFWVSDEGLKIKVNSGVWTVGYGITNEQP